MAIATEEDIRVRAYHLWEADGRPHGRDLEFWERARHALANGTHQASSATTGTGTAQRKLRVRAAAGTANGGKRRPAQRRQPSAP